MMKKGEGWPVCWGSAFILEVYIQRELLQTKEYPLYLRNPSRRFQAFVLLHRGSLVGPGVGEVTHGIQTHRPQTTKDNPVHGLYF